MTLNVRLLLLFVCSVIIALIVIPTSYAVTVTVSENIGISSSPIIKAPNIPVGQTSEALLSGGAATLDQTGTTNIVVSISGSTSPTGTLVMLITAIFEEKPATLADTPLPALLFFDVKIQGINDGTARVCITDPSAVPGSKLMYWTGTAWVEATNQQLTPPTLCGDIAVSALKLTPISIVVPSVGGDVIVSNSYVLLLIALQKNLLLIISFIAAFIASLLLLLGLLRNRVRFKLGL